MINDVVSLLSFCCILFFLLSLLDIQFSYALRSFFSFSGPNSFCRLKHECYSQCTQNPRQSLLNAIKRGAKQYLENEFIPFEMQFVLFLFSFSIFFGCVHNVHNSLVISAGTFTKTILHCNFELGHGCLFCFFSLLLFICL